MNKIYVGNLPFQTTDQELEGEFQQFGKIKEVALIRDRYSNEFKGFAFITFITPESAQQALPANGKDFQGRAMKVSIARAEERGGRSGGGGGGRGGREGAAAVVVVERVVVAIVEVALTVVAAVVAVVTLAAVAVVAEKAAAAAIGGNAP